MSDTHTRLSTLIEEAPAQAVAVYYADRVLTYGDLLAESDSVAAGLHARGLREGDRIAVWLPNIPAWLCLLFACARLGAVLVSVNTRFRAHEVADIVSRSGCSMLVLWPDFKDIDFSGILAAIAPEALRGINHVIVYNEVESSSAVTPIAGIAVSHYAELRASVECAPLTGSGAHRCVIFTTSGTTKAPKFVCHMQQVVTHHARDVALALGMQQTGSKVLQALPLCGVFGFTQALAALAARAPMVMLPVFDAALSARLVRERGITHMNGVDDMIDRMLAEVAEQDAFPSLEHFGYALFNPALEDIVERAAARGVILRGLYGMSECHAFYALQPLALASDERRKGGGLPVARAARVRVRDPDNGVLLGVGTAGEIEIAGPSLMAEYFGDAPATAAAFTADGFLRTGDLGYLEADGRFCYLARMGDVMRLAGFLTSPLEIEAVLDEHPAVNSSQVVAVEVDGAPAAVCFVLAAQTRPEEADVIAFCRSRLASYKVPRRVFIIDAFPTTLSANGTKIQKSRLRVLAQELLAEGRTSTTTTGENKS
jgi:fatty-acyl-CoA synthase